MAKRTSFNPLGLTLDVSFAPFETREGRGRPQTNAYITIDMSDVSEACASEGEKVVRLEAFKLLRNRLAVDSETPIVKHPKREGEWLLKCDSVCQNIHVKVGSVTPEDDSIFG